VAVRKVAAGLDTDGDPKFQDTAPTLRPSAQIAHDVFDDSRSQHREIPHHDCDLAIADIAHQQIQATTEGAEWLSENTSAARFVLDLVLLKTAVAVKD
jgi:hypothetical protein